MSLYSPEEICCDCELAVFHPCCKTFCHCSGHHESKRNHILGTCMEREEMQNLSSTVADLREIAAHNHGWLDGDI